eukprot:253233-Prorocentrum_minimum.AAC.2
MNWWAARGKVACEPEHISRSETLLPGVGTFENIRYSPTATNIVVTLRSTLSCAQPQVAAPCQTRCLLSNRRRVNGIRPARLASSVLMGYPATFRRPQKRAQSQTIPEHGHRQISQSSDTTDDVEPPRAG